MDDTIIVHESFGAIRASRVSGQMTLFDSALQHQHYVTITISRADQHRRYGQTYVHGTEDLITVAMSESQFAQFITSMNVGSGAPCTLTRVNNKAVEAPPADINTRQTFEAEIKAVADEMQAELKAGLAALNDLLASKAPITKTAVKAVQERVWKAQREIDGHLPFLMKQFAENMEMLTDRAKMDIDAHSVMLGQRMVSNEAVEMARLSEAKKEG